MIEVEHLTKYYGAFPALKDLNFNVEQGEILGFLGPNGAGKTTTMRIITGYLPATSGTVRVAGFDVADKSLDARRHLGYLPETVPLYPELTTLEYLDFKGRISGLHNRRDRRARIYEVMDELNVGDVSDRLIGTLSRGYRQRVGLAQAMLHNPDVLILDEPTVGLDPVQITEVRDMIKELGRNHTIILSTHLLPEVSMVCNRVIIINRGHLVALDTPIHLAEGAADTRSVQIEVAGRPAEVLPVLRRVPGVAAAVATDGQTAGASTTGSPEVTMPVSAEATAAGVHVYRVDGQEGADIRAGLASAVLGAGFSLLEMQTMRPTLEDVFVRVVSQDAAAEAEGEEEAGEYPEEEGYEEYPEEPEPAPVAVAPTREKVVLKKRARR